MDNGQSGNDAQTPMPIDQAVKRLFPYGGVTRATLLSACRAGQLSYAKIGNRFLVTQADIEDWLKRNRVEHSSSTLTSTKAESALPIGPERHSNVALAQMSLRRTIRILMGNKPPRKPRENDREDKQALPQKERAKKLQDRLGQWVDAVKDSDLNKREREVLIQLLRLGVGHQTKPSTISCASRTTLETLEIRGYVILKKSEVDAAKIISISITNDGMMGLKKPPASNHRI